MFSTIEAVIAVTIGKAKIVWPMAIPVREKS
jgi:hypothetical protein